MDFRKSYILNCIKVLLELQSQPKILIQRTTIQDFLNNSNQINLCFVCDINQKKSNSALKVALYKYGNSYDLTKYRLISINKLLPLYQITKDNISQGLSISFIQSDPLKSLSATLNNFYSILAQQRQEMKKPIDNLKTVIEGNSNEFVTLSYQFDFADQSSSAIHKPSDEFDFWKKYAETATGNNKLKAQFYTQVYKDIDKNWKQINRQSNHFLKQTITATIYCLQMIWSSEYEYRQDRFRSLLICFTKTIFAKLNINIPFFPCALQILSENISVFKYWSTEIHSSVDNIFPSTRYYRGGLQFLQFFDERIKKIQNISFIIKELSLSPLDIKVQIVRFQPFSDPMIIDTSICSAQVKCQQALKQNEKRIIDYFRSLQEKFFIPNSAMEALRKIHKFPFIWRRFSNKIDRVKMLQGIRMIVTQIEQQCNKKSGLFEESRFIQNKNYGPLLNKIVWARQMEGKLKKLDSLIESDFSGTQGDALLQQSIRKVNDQLKQQQESLFQQWQGNVLAKIEKKEFKFTESNIIYLDKKKGTFEVNYSDELILLIKQVRQLKEIGYSKKIKRDIYETAQTGKKFQKQAIFLKKIANIYNNMGSEILYSQKKMIIEQAVAFEQCIAQINQRIRSKQLTHQSLNLEIKFLNQSCQALLKQNNRLKYLHKKIEGLVVKMADFNLSKEKHKWKEYLGEIKKLIDIGSQGKKEEYCLRWRIHWDLQMLKVLKVQFIQGIENILIPEINAEIIISNEHINIKPSLEQLKTKYYFFINEFLKWPQDQFRGLGSRLYGRITFQHKEQLQIMFLKIESDVFVQMERKMEELKYWQIVLCLMNQDFVFQSFDDWEFNIRKIRTKRRDIEKIPDFFKLMCFNISTRSFKNNLDDIFHNLIEKLTVDLKESIVSQKIQIEKFCSGALQKLKQKPKTIEQMQAIKNQYFDLRGKQREIEIKAAQVEVKNKWIRNMLGFYEDLTQMHQNLQVFKHTISDFDQILKQQLEHLKKEMIIRQKQLVEALSIFKAKLEGRKVNMKLAKFQQARQSCKIYAEQVQEWKNLNSIYQKILEDCLKFEMPRPNIDIQPIKIIMDTKAQVLAGFQEFQKQLSDFQKIKWSDMKSRLYQFHDWVVACQQKVKNCEKQTAGYLINTQLKNYISGFALLKLCQGQSLQKEHWRQLFFLLKINKNNHENLLFQDFLKNFDNLLQKGGEIKELIARAQGEFTLRQAIQQLRLWIQTAQFQFTLYHTQTKQIPIIKQWKEMLTKVSDNQALLSSLKQSKYVVRFAEQVNQFEQMFNGLDQLISDLNIIQRKWIYLQPIFLRGALPSHLEQFKQIDEKICSILTKINLQKKVVSINVSGQIEYQKSIIGSLQLCQKALNQYLQQKRDSFPRFYFLGDQDLLEILGQGGKIEVVSRHLKKLFAAIHKVSCYEEIEQFHSAEGQSVLLDFKVKITQDIQIWLKHLETSMFRTLQNLCHKRVHSKNKDLELQLPSQIICLLEQIKFGQLLSSLKFLEIRNYLLSFLENLTSKTHKSSKLSSIKLKSLILDIIYNLSSVDELIKLNTTSMSQYPFLKILRYIFNQNVNVSLLGYQFQYTYQYQGNLPKLVHTPLTDKCFMTIAIAIKMGYGGNPYGPAGTGKTQSVKSLAMALGRLCLVFNCDEGIDFKSMGRIFVGLIRSGAWGCFDEFNRLLEEQLSAISQQIQTIQWAIKENKDKLILINKEIEVNKNSGIYVTMNPAGKGYGGRSKLPDNLKQLFRPVAMSLPDNQLIAEVLLYAEGFKQAKVLAQKIISIFTLSKQIMSEQQHYDWGLRAIKTILTVAGRLIFEQRSRGIEVDYNIECELLIKAIRINTLSKLTFPDMKKFIALLEDVFPGIQSNDIIYQVVTKAIHQALKAMDLMQNQNQINKILQFYQACQQRMGVVLMGPSGCGKTTIWKVLKKARQIMGDPIRTYIINPKSMPRSQLLGLMNNDTRQFTEGVLTQAAKNVVKNEQASWIVLDGDVDPEWIESLNSVLDDNHLMTLPTGQRISFLSNVNFIFETDNLKYASPATVSRMGMIYLNEQDISIANLIHNWLSGVSLDRKVMLEKLIKIIDLEELVMGMEEKQVVPSTLVGRTESILSQLNVNTQKQFITGLIRGVCSNLFHEQQIQKVNFIMKSFNQMPVHNVKKQPLQFYAKDNNFMVYSNISTSITQQSFSNVQECPIIQTAELQRYRDILNPWILQKNHIIIVGPQGCGKSLLVRFCLEELKKNEKIITTHIHCNAQTSGTQVLQKLSLLCHKSTNHLGRIYRPNNASRIVLVLSNVNLPTPDKYETIQLIAFLNSIVSHKGFYDPQTLDFIQVQEVQLICIINPPSYLGRHFLSKRFTAKTRIIKIDEPKLGCILESYYLGYFNKNQQIGKRVYDFLLQFYQKVSQRFVVDTHRHYLISSKSIVNIFYGLMKYESNSEFIAQIITNQVNKNFRDKLVTLQQKEAFDSIVNGLVKKNFGKSVSANVFFSSIGSQQLVRLSKNDYMTLINQGIVNFQREFSQINLVVTQEVMQIMSSLDRLFSLGKNVFFAGRSGTGRKTFTKIMAHMCRLEVYSLPTILNYSIRQFRKDMRNLMEIVAGQNKKTVLLMEDHHFTRPQFLESINSLLSSGQIPGLINTEEIERIVSDHQNFRKEYYGKTLNEAFAERIKKNLRIVISMDHNDPNFNKNCAYNPGLFSKCTLIWTETISMQSIRLIIKSRLNDILGTVDSPIELQSKLIQLYDHGTQKFSTTNRELFYLINTFRIIFKKKTKSKNQQLNYLNSGLDKLKQAQQLVDKLSIQAEKKKVLLRQKQKEADQALESISKAMGHANSRKIQTQKYSKKLEAQEQKIKLSKNKAQQELAEVTPLINQAKKAVTGISRSHLDQLRSMSSPPTPIQHVMKVVLNVLGIVCSSFKDVKTVLKGRIIETVLNFDPRKLNDSTRKEIDNLIKKHPESFQKEVIYRASQAAGPLCDWVKAILKYSKVLQGIAPLEKQLFQLEQQLKKSKKNVQQCEEQLAKIDTKVQSLKDDFSKKTSQASALQLDLNKAEQTMKVASVLLSKLDNQKFRWQKQTHSIQEQIKMIPINSLLCSAFCTFLSDKDENIRKQVTDEWKKMTGYHKWNFLSYITTEGILLKFKADGLNDDQLSLENAQIVFNTCKVPLMLDPNQKAIEWLKTHLRKIGTLQIINQQDPKLATKLELAVRFGKTLMIEQIDNIQPILVPLLKEQFNIQGPRKTIYISDKQVDYTDTFKLYLCSRNSSIIFQPFIAPLIQIINFSVTRSGLQNQLLSIIINHEQPELEKRKKELLAKEENLKIDLQDVQKKLLKQLASSKGNILENKQLLDSLNKTKIQSESINESLKESQKISKQIDKERNIYKSLAKKAAQVFLIIETIYLINNMYRYSLNYFLSLFTRSLNIQLTFDNQNQKLQAIATNLYKIVYNNIATSLLKYDRLIFGIHLLHGTRPQLFKNMEWEFFLGNTTGTFAKQVSFPTWIPNDRKQIYSNMVTNLKGIDKQMNFDDRQWQIWIKQVQCQHNFPSFTKNKISSFQKVILIQVFRPQRLQSALSKFVIDNLGITGFGGQISDLKQLIPQISEKISCLFIVSPGFDPTKQLEDFATKQIGKGRLKQFSLGGGQNDQVFQILSAASKNGDWVCLKNLHLVISFLTNLQKYLKSIKPQNSFRLFLTTEPHPKFPKILLENSFKMSYQAPPGIKRNLYRTFKPITPLLNSVSSNKGSLLFLLSLFHSIVIERKAYVPQGWSKAYQFGQTDFRVAEQIILERPDMFSTKDYTFLHGVIQQAVYGGRIDNPFDLKVLSCYLHKYLSLSAVEGNTQIINGMTMTKSFNLKEITAIVQRFPESDSPQMFGLPHNIDKSLQRYSTQILINNLKGMANINVSNVNYDKKEWGLIIKPIMGLWKKVFQQIMEMKLPIIKDNQLISTDPVQSFIFSEGKQAFSILQTIHSQMRQLQEVLYGNGLMETEIERVAKKLLKGQVPQNWCKIWSGPDLITDWIKGFTKRIFSLKNWISKTQTKQLLSQALDLSQLYRPQIFFNAIRQRTSRILKIPLNQLKLVNSFANNKMNLVTCFQIKNLLLQGCQIKNSCLVKGDLAMPEFIFLENLYVDFVHNNDIESKKNNEQQFPLFINANRQKLLGKLKFEVKDNVFEKIIAGTAILLSQQ